MCFSKPLPILVLKVPWHEKVSLLGVLTLIWDVENKFNPSALWWRGWLRYCLSSVHHRIKPALTIWFVRTALVQTLFFHNWATPDPTSRPFFLWAGLNSAGTQANEFPYPAYGAPVARNCDRCKPSPGYPAPPFRKWKHRWADLECSPYVVIREKVTYPFSALPAQIICPANEKMSYEGHVLRKAHCGTAHSGSNSAPRISEFRETSDTVLGDH